MKDVDRSRLRHSMDTSPPGSASNTRRSVLSEGGEIHALSTET